MNTTPERVSGSSHELQTPDFTGELRVTSEAIRETWRTFYEGRITASERKARIEKSLGSSSPEVYQTLTEEREPERTSLLQEIAAEEERRFKQKKHPEPSRGMRIHTRREKAETRRSKP